VCPLQHFHLGVFVVLGQILPDLHFGHFFLALFLSFIPIFYSLVCSINIEGHALLYKVGDGNSL
jgi:hypothetical protein